MSRPHCQRVDACQAKGAGHCRRCQLVALNADPAALERKRAAIRAKHADPEFAAKHRERLAQTMAEVLQRPEYRERLRRHGIEQYRNVLSRPDVRARNQAPEVRAAAGRKRTETILGWCPPELRADYEYLVRTQHIPAAQARIMIEERIPGTVAHAKRAVANEDFNGRLKHADQKRQAY